MKNEEKKNLMVTFFTLKILFFHRLLNGIKVFFFVFFSQSWN